MASLLARRLVLTPGASSSVPSRTFHASSSACAGKKGLGKTNKSQQGKKVVSRAFKSSGKKTGKDDGSGPKRIDAGGLVKIDHPLFLQQSQTHILPELDPQTLTPQVIGKPFAFPSLKTSAVNVFGVPKNMSQEFVHLAQPFSVVRQTTLDVLDTLDKAVALPSDQTRVVLTGESGSGKSTLLLQAVNYCAANGWFVVYVPKAIDWVNSSSPYQYDYRSQLFHQTKLAADMLQKMITFNAPILSAITVAEDVPLPGGKAGAVFKSGTSLETVAQHGVRDEALAPQTLVLLMEQLGLQDKYPVLFAVDDFQALYNVSQYRDPSFNLIRGYNLSMPRLVLEYASGRRKFNRGAVLGALSSTNTSFPVRLELKEALGIQNDAGFAPGPYAKRVPELEEFAKGLQSIPVPSKFTLPEASSVFEVWNANKALHTGLNDTFFLAKFAETGGNPRELLRRGIMSTLQT